MTRGAGSHKEPRAGQPGSRHAPHYVDTGGAGVPFLRPVKQESARSREPGLGPGRLEELERVSGGVLEQDLPAAHSRDDLVPEARALLLQRCRGGGGKLSPSDHANTAARPPGPGRPPPCGPAGAGGLLGAEGGGGGTCEGDQERHERPDLRRLLLPDGQGT